MNDNPTSTQPPAPELVDMLIEQLGAKLDEIEQASRREARLVEIPPDVPRFVTVR